MLFTQTLLALCAASAALAQPTVYLIRHGEKPESGNGLNAQGQQRAQCLRSVFGSSSPYNIGKILAQQYKSDLGIPVETPCDRDDPDCVAKVVKNYKGAGNILICWEHKRLTDIVDSLGDKDAPEYPSDRFDQIWTDPYSYKSITSITSENCPGLDS